MKWYKIHLDVKQIVEGHLLKIHHQFTILWEKNNFPENAAMFSDTLTEEGENIYFTPGSRDFIQGILLQYPGEEIKAPRRNEIGLLAGHADAWK
ncbi:MAG: hypothetical protein JSW02_07685 [candidate division WOR-3 bacterium]|nr:MAG: hypothetical protein JSW02_07685 [candidate division WOR-3 bacterium]